MLGFVPHFQNRVQCSVLCLSLNRSPFPFKLPIPGEYMKLQVLCQSFINTPQLVTTIIVTRVVVGFPAFSPVFYNFHSKNKSVGNYANFADRPDWIRSHCKRI